MTIPDEGAHGGPPPDGDGRRPKRSLPKARTAAEIQEWFVEALAKVTDVSPEKIESTVPFEHFGLDSVTAVGLTGELEEWLGFEVDPMAVYDYPTIKELSNHLCEESVTRSSG